MDSQSPDKLVVAITARALFHLEDSHDLFERDGVAAYADHQRLHENDPLAPGIAFPLVRKLLALNGLPRPSMASDALGLPPDGHADAKPVPRVEVILLSRNSSDTGLRIFNSIEHYGLGIVRAVFTSGAPTFPYIQPFGAQLFLSANPDSVRRALEHGVAAATILPASAEAPRDAVFQSAQSPLILSLSKDAHLESVVLRQAQDEGIKYPEPTVVRQAHHERVEDVHGKAIQQLRIAFDGDAVIFGDESERVSRESGLEAFAQNERERFDQPLSGGPFRGFLAALHRLQSAFPAENSPIRTALVTARSAPAHKRVILTLREWGVRLDEALFLGGRDKGPFLQAFGADIFFDDSSHNIESARRHVAAGHVPHGVTNN